ncbi:MAG: M56 family metallopeptidase [Pseudomonadales bacterium]
MPPAWLGPNGGLKALASSRGRLGIVPGRAPLAVAGGVLDPVVLLSRGLLDQLTLRQRRIVAAHEAAHLRHGDVWRNVLFELLLIAHLPRVRRKLREQWLRALEEHADDVVAQRFGAEDVVDVLLQVARLKLRQPPHGFSVAGSDLPGRVWRLLDGPRGDHGGSPFFAIVYASGLATLFAAAVTGHHTLETLLGLVAGH